MDKLINGGVLYFIVEIGSRDQTCWNPHTGFLDGIVIFSRDKDKKVKYITYFEGDSLDRNCVKAPLEKNGEEVLFCMNFFADQGGTHNQYLERLGEVGPGDGKRAYALEQNITAATMYPADQSYGIECNQKPVRMFFDFDQLRYSQQTHRLEMEVVYADPEQIVEACSDPSRKFLPLTGKPTTSISIDARRALKGTLEYDYLRGKIRLINHR